MKIHSPRGMVLRSEIYLNNRDTCFKVKCKMMLLYLIYGRFAGCRGKELFRRVHDKGLWIVCQIPALMLYLSWKRKYGKDM